MTDLTPDELYQKRVLDQWRHIEKDLPIARERKQSIILNEEIYAETVMKLEKSGFTVRYTSSSSGIIDAIDK